MVITEPRWKSLIVETTGEPLFTPEQCQRVIEAGRSQPKIDAKVGTTEGSSALDTKTRTSHISWIPFNLLPEMYKKIEKVMLQTNGNHFGFNGMQLTEYAQYTEYPEGGFYDWHVDNDVTEGGETEFLYQKCRFKPEKNTLLVWPSQFTHVHRGNPPLSNDKYIITGWVEYLSLIHI